MPWATIPSAATARAVASETRPSASAAYVPPWTRPNGCLCLEPTSKRALTVSSPTSRCSNDRSPDRVSSGGIGQFGSADTRAG
jgi:hypothetical protein